MVGQQHALLQKGRTYNTNPEQRLVHPRKEEKYEEE
jgi:hypothetical protein